jgi:hypothetical protein
VRSESLEGDDLRRNLFLVANIPTSMHLRIIWSQAWKNLWRSGFWRIHLLFDVGLQAAVAVLQKRNLTHTTNVVGLICWHPAFHNFRLRALM